MTAVITVAAIFVVYIILSAFGARRCMEIPREQLRVYAESTRLRYENVEFSSRGDNVLLKGWYFPGDSDTSIIIVNGGFNPRVDDNSDTLGLTGALVKKGYHVLLFDLRGRGESAGKGQALTNIDADIGGAVRYLEGRGFPLGCICLVGFCSGAAQACLYASRNNIGMLVLDGCFIDVPTMVVREAATAGVPRVLVRIFVPGLCVMTRLIYGYKVVNPLDVIGDVKCPVFFIHEEHDEFTTWGETERLYSASSNPANEIWQVRDSQHSRSFRNSPEEYAGKIDSFLRKHSGESSDRWS